MTPAGKPRHVFSKPDPGVAWLNREYIPHLAAFARAALDFGLDASRASLSLYRKFGRDLVTKRAGQGFETDAEFYASDGRIHLQIEAKADRGQELGALRPPLERLLVADADRTCFGSASKPPEGRTRFC